MRRFGFSGSEVKGHRLDCMAIRPCQRRARTPRLGGLMCFGAPFRSATHWIALGQKLRIRCSYARPNTAISAQELDPQRTYLKEITSNSQRSRRALLACGSGISLKVDRKTSTSGSSHLLSVVTIWIGGLPVPTAPAHILNIELGLPSEKALSFVYRR